MYRPFAFAALLAMTTLSAKAREWTPEVWDFGTFEEEKGPVPARFVLVNTGSTPLSIISARPTCGCTSPVFSDSPIAPGDSTELLVTYDPAGRPGYFDKKVYVELSDGSPRRTLHIRGTVIGAKATVEKRYPIEADPLRLTTAILPFGEVRDTQVKSNYIELYNNTPDSITYSVAQVPPYIHILTSPNPVPPGSQGVISATWYGKDTPTVGFVCDTLMLLPDSRSPEKKVPLTFTANVTQDFSALTEEQMQRAPRALLSPTTLDFGQLSPSDGEKTLHVTVTNEGTSAPLHIRRAYIPADTGNPYGALPAGALTIGPFPDKIKKGKSAHIPVTIHPSLLASHPLVNTQLTLITDDPIHPTLTLRIIAELTPR